MPLPSLEKVTPIFDLVVPSTKQTLKFRPFLVKEEKILLMALQEDDEKVIFDAICQVVGLCAMSPLRIDKLAIFDIEYLFLKLRSHSVGEIVDLSYRCRNRVLTSQEDVKKITMPKLGVRKKTDVEQETPTEEPVLTECQNVVTLQLNLKEVEVSRKPNHTNKIFLTDTLGVTMKYPTIEMANKVNKSGDPQTLDQAIAGIAMCIEAVFDESNMFSNFTIPEMVEWLEKLSQTHYMKIEEFFDTMPSLSHDLQFHCDKCGHQEVIHLEGLTAFFG